MPLLSDDIITLRAPEPDDIDMLYRWENNTDLWSVGITVAPYSRKQLADYIATYNGDIFSERQLRLIIMLNANHESIGTIDLFDYDPVNGRCAVGILVDDTYSRQGYGLRSLNLISRYCFSRLGLHQLYCIIPEDNTASRRLFIAAGYKAVGRLRSWLRRNNRYLNAYIYQHLLTSATD